MKQTPMTRRLGEQLREKLGYILLFEISDPRLELVTLTGVEVSQDRSFARVFVSCEAIAMRRCWTSLTRPRAEFAASARSLDWRVTPELQFKIDRSTDEAEAISRALENIPATLAVEKDEFGYPIEDADVEKDMSDEQ